MEQVAAGDVLSSAERGALDGTIRRAEQLSRVEFSVFIGDVQGNPRDHATSLHNSLVVPTRSVLIMVDPEQRILEIVTGGYVRRTLSDREVELAVATMQSLFAEGDLAGGLCRGITHLAEHAVPAGALPGK